MRRSREETRCVPIRSRNIKARAPNSAGCRWNETNLLSRGCAVCDWRSRNAAARRRFRSPGLRLLRVHPAGLDEAVLSRKYMLRRPSASVAHRLPIVASVGRAQALAGPGVNHDALGIAPEVLDLQRVSLGTQQIHCIGREAVFHFNYVGEPLMMEPVALDGV